MEELEYTLYSTHKIQTYIATWALYYISFASRAALHYNKA